MDSHTPVTRGLRILGAVLITLGVSTVVGPLGILVGVTVLGAFVVLPRPLGVVYAQLVIAALTPTITRPVLLAECGVLLALGGILPSDSWRTRGSILLGIAITAVVWYVGVWPQFTPGFAAISLVGVTGLGIYALHRYERVRLHLVR